MDDEGLDADAFETRASELQAEGALLQSDAAQSNHAHDLAGAANRHSPTIALRYAVPIIEDDPYGMLPSRRAGADRAARARADLATSPGLVEVPGRRAAHRLCRGSRVRRAQLVSSALRSTTVMASPITMRSPHTGSTTARPTQCSAQRERNRSSARSSRRSRCRRAAIRRIPKRFTSGSRSSSHGIGSSSRRICVTRRRRGGERRVLHRR